MAHRTALIALGHVPPLARWLGLAGLAPQILLAAIVFGFSLPSGSPATGLALFYSALILSFIGGAWWGLATRRQGHVPSWIWLAAVSPSLIAFAAIGAGTIGRSPGLGLMISGASLVATLGVDLKMVAIGLCPAGWLRLRMPLSSGLGGLTMLIAAAAQ